jgi:hypothetical protein
MAMFPLIYGAAIRGAVDANAANTTAKSARSKAGDAASSARQLEQRLEQLTLACMAMWSLLREKTNLTEEDLMQRVKQIDLADGQEDGKVRTQTVQCPQCNRTMSRRHDKCIYCGSAKPSATAFDGAM